jgi:hypothetical protein
MSNAESSFFPPVAAGLSWEELDTPSVPLREPGWMSPPWHERPGVVALSVELGRSESTVVLVEGARAYREGVVLTLVVRVRELQREARRRLFEQLGVNHGRGSLKLSLPPGGLRWGVEFADGKRVTNVDEYSPWNALPAGADPAEWTPDRPIMLGLGRPSTEYSTWSRNIWLWPLPPPGSLRLVAAWPDRGIIQTSVSIDSAALREAAATAQPTWNNG